MVHNTSKWGRATAAKRYAEGGTVKVPEFVRERRNLLEQPEDREKTGQPRMGGNLGELKSGSSSGTFGPTGRESIDAKGRVSGFRKGGKLQKKADGGGVKPPKGEVKPLPIQPDKFIRDKSGRPTAYDADVLYRHAGIDPATGDPLKKRGGKVK